MSGSNDWPVKMHGASSLLPTPRPEGAAAFVDIPPRRNVEPNWLSLKNDVVSPHEAMLEDLFFLRGVFDEAGIEFVLVRGVDARSGAVRPTLAVNQRDRMDAVAALADACRDEPMYSKPAHDAARSRSVVSSPLARKPRGGVARRSKVLVSTGTLGGRESDRAFVLYRPRVTSNGSLRFGARFGVRLEFWVYDAGDIHLPNENALTRSTLPRDEAHATTTQQFGATWPTLAGMWNNLADDIDFPIDIVFSWVDGTDLEWQRARAARMQSYVVGEGDNHEARYRQIDELKYAMRSVHLFAPWIRNIFIVTDSPRPEWLADHPRVRVMRSAEFFSDPEVLPTYNSHAVESQLHRIPGLSEHFIYSNDDMFFGRELSPQAFFTSGGISRFVESNTRIGLGDASPVRSGFENAARVNRALLEKKFGRTISRHLEHSPAPMRRSVLEELESNFPEEFARTASARFRSQTDISVTNSLYHFFAIMTGRAVTQENISVKYVDTTSREGIDELDVILRKRSHDHFCLNDGSFPEVSEVERLGAVTHFLDSYFPIPAPWENPSH